MNPTDDGAAEGAVLADDRPVAAGPPARDPDPHPDPYPDAGTAEPPTDPAGTQTVHAVTQARRLFAAGDDSGVRALADALETEPLPRNRGNLMRMIGLAALRQGDAADGRDWLEAARDDLGDDDVALSVALGGACLADGSPGTAEAHFRYALARVPNAVGACVGLACALEGLNDRAGALVAWRHAVAALVTLTPSTADPWMLGLPSGVARGPVTEMAAALHEAGDEAGADRLLTRLAALFPADADILEVRAQVPQTGAETGPDHTADAEHGLLVEAGPDGPRALMDQAHEASEAGHREAARQLYQRAGALAVAAPSPLDDDLAALALGAADALRRLGDPGTATGLLERLAEHRPDDPEVTRERALSLQAGGDAEAALALVERTEASLGRTRHVPLLLVHAGLLHQLGRLDEAAGVCARAVAADPAAAAPYRDLAQILEQAQRPDEAMAACHAALLRDPAQTWCRSLIARVLESRNQLDPAIEHHGRVLDSDPDSPDAHLALALALLKRGDWTDGWEEYEWRVLKTDRPPDSFGQRPWEGEPLDGRRLLIWHEMQGVVEELMFLRLAPAAARLANGPLVIEADPRLVPLLARGMPDVTVVPVADPPAEAVHAPDVVAQVPFGSLPRLVAPEPAAGVTGRPTIAADEGRAAALRERYLADGEALLVGLCWSPLGSRRRRERRVPLSALDPLFALEGVRFVALQPGSARAKLERLRAERTLDAVIDPEIDAATDLDGLAAQITACDMVVSADALVAHLTGSLAVPGLLLLPFAADWRWGLSGTRTPWYPSLRLARQTVPRDWSRPVARAAAAVTHYRDAARAAGGTP
ncbi:tetratricopeptide repeat protein [Roseospira goensis]|uniref:Tetratricopeptide (TPR) repeat protein n=1 Tax=Roseospira goensis TaxID=391922 RepID=A0A7W6WK58_9PROT|nr:tetratricopeptide (TPR) repeat protein [Roseospira goensis]